MHELPSLSATTRTLTCRDADGTVTKASTQLPPLTEELSGSDDLSNAFASVLRAAGVPARAGLSTTVLATGTATADGASVTAQLSVKRLAWQGGGLTATGTLGYQATVTTDLGTATCSRVATAFNARPS